MALVRNFISLSGAELASKLITFAAFAFLARMVGPDGFGLIEFALSSLLCAGLIVDQGFSSYGAREIAKAPARTQSLVAEIVGARSLLAVVAYGGMVALALTLNRSEPAEQLLLLYGLSLFALPFLMQWVFQGHDQMDVVAASQLLRQSVFGAVVFATIRAPGDLWLVAVAELAATGSAAAYTVWMLRRRLGTTVRVSLHPSADLFRQGGPIGLSQMLWVLRMFGGTVLVGLVALPADVGYFGGAQRVLIAVHTFVWLYYFNLLPSLTRTWQGGEASFRATVDSSLRLVAWAAVPVAVLWVASAPALMVIAYGADFSPGAISLQWLAGVWVAAAISGHYRFGLIAAGRQNAELAAAAVGALIAVVGIPFGYLAHGLAGAAIALVAAEVGVWLASWWWGRRLLHLRNHPRLLVLPAAAACLALTVLWIPIGSPAVRAGTALFATATLAIVLDGNVRSWVATAVIGTGR